MSIETDRIEADVNASRHRLNDTLDALGQKLSPGQMLDEVLGLAQGQAGQFAAKLGNQVKENPLPTLLIAAGIGMLLLNGRHHEHTSAEDWSHDRVYRSLEDAHWATPRRAGESDEGYDERVHQAYAKTLNLAQMADEAADAFKARVAKTVEGARANAESARARIAHAVAGAKHAVEDQAQTLGRRASAVKHGAENFYDETPLATGAIALAVGALIGAATPLSRAEQDALHGLAAKTARTGADLAERGAQAVEQRLDGAFH